MADDVCDPAQPILVPRMDDDEKGWDHTTPGPAWLPTVGQDQTPRKPLLKCKCGVVSGIGLHHVAADGTVMNSIHCTHCCGWHVYVKLLNYDQGEFQREP